MKGSKSQIRAVREFLREICEIDVCEYCKNLVKISALTQISSGASELSKEGVAKHFEVGFSNDNSAVTV